MGETAEAEGALAPPYASSIDIIFTFRLLVTPYPFIVFFLLCNWRMACLSLFGHDSIGKITAKRISLGPWMVVALAVESYKKYKIQNASRETGEQSPTGGCFGKKQCGGINIKHFIKRTYKEMDKIGIC